MTLETLHSEAVTELRETVTQNEQRPDIVLTEKIGRLNHAIDYAQQRLHQLAQASILTPQPMPADNPNQSHKAAFLTYIRKGSEDALLQHKALSVQNDPEGGFAVPPDMLNHIITTAANLSPLRQLMRVETITSDSVELLLDKDHADAGWVSEVEERAETKTPELAKLRIPAHELYARCRATQKLLDDSCIDIEEWLIQKVAERLAQLENQAFIQGDGLCQPRGLLKYPTVPVENHTWGKLGVLKTGKAGSFADDNPANVLVHAVEWLSTNYLPNACWLMPRRLLAEVRCLRLGDYGYVWQPSFQAKTPDMLLGYPVVSCDEMPGLSNDSLSILFGDFRAAYQIIDRQGIRILRDPFSAKPYVELYITKRVGGDVINFDAVKAIQFSA